MTPEKVAQKQEPYALRPRNSTVGIAKILRNKGQSPAKEFERLMDRRGERGEG